MQFSNEELTKIYNEANGIPEGKFMPITTERIFTAMRAMPKAARKIQIERDIAGFVAVGKCKADGDLATTLRKLG